MLTPVDTTRLSEHIMRMTDVLCLSAVTVHGLVLEWLDAEGLDVRPGHEWVGRLLRGMRLSCKKPAKRLKELHAPALQEANAHWVFFKLCFIPPRSTLCLQPCDVAVFRSFKSCIQAQASATLARSVLDGTFDGLATNKAWRR